MINRAQLRGKPLEADCKECQTHAHNAKSKELEG